MSFLEDEVDDCIAGFHWAHEQARRLGADRAELVIVGGAFASATVCGVVKAGKAPQFAGLVTLNGTVGHPDATPERYKHLMRSYIENAGRLPFVSRDDTMGLYKHWEITPANINIDVFPVMGGPEALKGFQSTFIITSDNDASRDDGTVLEAMLREHGVPVKLECFKGLAHYFWTFPLPKANERVLDVFDGWDRMDDIRGSSTHNLSNTREIVKHSPMPKTIAPVAVPLSMINSG